MCCCPMQVCKSPVICGSTDYSSQISNCRPPLSPLSLSSFSCLHSLYKRECAHKDTWQQFNLLYSIPGLIVTLLLIEAASGCDRKDLYFPNISFFVPESCFLIQNYSWNFQCVTQPFGLCSCQCLCGNVSFHFCFKSILYGSFSWH